jgi:peptidoglycan/xylan/chitin deacetylase (PgdA/CDA1 family)
MRNKRLIIARCLRRAGVLALLERLAQRPGLLALTYHRVGDPATHPFYPGIASGSPEDLRAELEILARSRCVVTLDEALARAEDGFSTSKPLALVTFDDGYRDNAEAALPILSSMGLPATFFLTTEFVSGRLLPWWDHIAFVVNSATTRVLAIEAPERMTIDLSVTSRANAIHQVVAAYLAHPEVDERALRAGLEERAGVNIDEPRLARALFMTWDQARELAAAGIDVGSHTVTHRALGRLSEPEVRSELVESRRVLAAELGRNVEALAYPYGWPGAFDATTSRVADETGYRAAFTAGPGMNIPGAVDRFALLRVNVGFGDPPVLHRARWALIGATGRSPL